MASYVCAVVEKEQGVFEVATPADVRTTAENAARYPEGLQPSVIPSGRYANYTYLRVSFSNGGEYTTEEEFRQGIEAVVGSVVGEKSPEPAALADIVLALNAQRQGYEVTMHVSGKGQGRVAPAPTGSFDELEGLERLAGMAGYVLGSLGSKP